MGDNARVTFTVDGPGRAYFIAVGAFDYHEGTYTLLVDY